MTLVDRDLVVDGARLAYRHTAGTSGEVVVFLHGTPSHSFLWRNVIPGIEARDHSVVAFDLLGYGRSERPVAADTSVTAQARLLEGLLDQLGIGACTLIAHDIGGAVAQIFATRHPDRVARLMLVDSVSYDSWPSATWRQILRRYPEGYAGVPQQEFEDLLARQLTMTVADPDHMSGAVLDAYLAPHRTPVGRTSFFEHQVRHYDSRPTVQVAPLLKTLPMPVLVVWGELDRWQPVDYGRRLAEDIPGGELVTVADAGHFLVEDRPDRVVEEIDRLLALPA